MQVQQGTPTFRDFKVGCDLINFFDHLSENLDKVGRREVNSDKVGVVFTGCQVLMKPLLQ